MSKKSTFLLLPLSFCCLKLSAQNITGVMTDRTSKFEPLSGISIAAGDKYDAEVLTDQPRQEVQGFGGCFNELGWTALDRLNESDRAAVMKELFAPKIGACFTICRMPVGANDFSLKWYSYDETDGDFEMKHFSIDNDKKTLVPFIKSALRQNPRLQLWASPWSPPQWMKYNHHYAEAMFPLNSPYHNGITKDQVGHAGANMFIQNDRYFKAYALYFSKFIAAYAKQGIKIGMVMPQNEFMSAQVFPSCTWTAAGLEKFLITLGPAMEQKGVKVFFGTMNTARQSIADTILSSPLVGRYIKGVGLQWAGKGAIGAIHQSYPSLTLYQSEQECGNGKNDWDYCKYTWGLMKHYFNNGVNAYMYWNIALQQGGISHWGWRQNSLITVDSASRSYVFNNEYFLLKHLSHFVQRGAHLLTISGEFNNMLAFQNPDHSIVLVVQNDKNEQRNVSIRVGKWVITAPLKADSFNTIYIRDLN